MTSQIAIINHSGVALASDTVTTLGGSKTLGNATKIFQLPEPHSIVVLHNGAVYLNNVHALLLLSEWSRQLTKEFGTSKEYYQSFVEWFNSSKAIHSPQSEDELLTEAIEDYLNWLAGKMRSAGEEEQFLEGMTWEQYEETKLRAHVAEIENSIKSSSNWKLFPDFTDIAAQELITNTKSIDLGAMVRNHFGAYNLPKAVIAKIQKAAVLGVSRVSSMNSDSELVFAGFGANEPFGRVYRLRIRGAYGKKLKFTLELEDGVSNDHPRATLIPLAQDDAINSFGRGWNPRIRDAVSESIWDKSWEIIYEAKLASKGDEELSDKDYEEVSQLAQKIKNKVLESVDDFSKVNFIFPLMDAVDAMSLTSVSELAESLIGIQAASTYSKKGAATVGGFVEVVTIDRQQGVRWIKRLPQARVQQI